MINTFKLYASVACIALIGGAAWHYNHLISSNKQLRSDLSAKTAELEQSQGLLAKERQNAQEAANRALALSIDEARNEEEYQRRTKCIADKSCGYVLRYKACPAVSSTAANQPQSDQAAAESERQFQRWANYHQYVIKQWEARVRALESDLKARSAPDYCQPK